MVGRSPRFPSTAPRTLFAYQLQKGTHLEFLREIGHLRVRSNTFGAAFRG